MEVCGRRGWGWSKSAAKRAWSSLRSPRPPCPRWLLIGFATAGLRLHSRAEPSAGELTPERCGGLGAGPRAPVSRGVPHPAPHRPTPALRQLRPAEDPQPQHGLLHQVDIILISEGALLSCRKDTDTSAPTQP
ncbi:PREDICTED: neurogranin isoform X1 [Hipposideros armiger]|uniref:Neurogranin isoform X1 n=1 Tax=Hipposideros armiger TaxID=186990 RepID=A0A8B7SP51_HIPAR|nr:PREDICTED: neurogranin isoform X1 [Hipposideros armiger]